MTLLDLKKELRQLADSSKSKLLAGFFKTGRGEYGEGDIFLGITVPNQRKIAKKYYFLSYNDLSHLLKSKIHEERLISLIILIKNFNLNSYKRKEIYDFYIKNIRFVNNWDLVDLSAPQIIGNYLIEKDKSILYKYSKSENLWERRISIISTFYFIKNNKFKDALKISKMLIKDKHDLIHKAVGWMLREIGKRDINVLKSFLKNNYKNMPRTMLRYAIEKFAQKSRKDYLKGNV